MVEENHPDRIAGIPTPVDVGGYADRVVDACVYVGGVHDVAAVLLAGELPFAAAVGAVGARGDVVDAREGVVVFFELRAAGGGGVDGAVGEGVGIGDFGHHWGGGGDDDGWLGGAGAGGGDAGGGVGG